MSDDIYETPSTTPNFQTELAAQLADLIPEVIADGKVDVEKLKELLGSDTADSSERFGLFWPGKKRALRAAQEPTTATLRPDFENSKDWDTTKNVFIEGDNLEVLKILQKHYHGKIKMIYIDPPYNTGKDFVYPDNYKEGLESYLEWTRQVNEEGKKVSTNAETEGRYHSNWLNMMYPRLKLARNLLSEDGVIFMSIDNHEQENLKKLGNEVFGEGNFIECLTWNKRIPKNDKGVGSIHEYVLVYARSLAAAPELTMRKDGLDVIEDLLKRLRDKAVPLPEAEREVRQLFKKQGYDRGITLYNELDAQYRLWGKINMSWPNANSFGPRYEVLHPVTARPVKIPDRGWRWKEDTFNEAAKVVDGKYTDVQRTHGGGYICGRIWFSSDENMQPSSINFLDEVDRFLLRSVLSMKSDGGIEVEKLFEGKSYFSYPKPTSLLRTLVASVPMKDGDIVLDFFSGSATTGHAVMQLNQEDHIGRRHIQVQLPEPIEDGSVASSAGFADLAQIARERLRRAGADIGSAPTLGSAIDLGFRSYKLSDTNFSKWRMTSEVDANMLQQHLLELRDSSSLDGATPDDLLVEILLKQGYSLTEKIAQAEIAELDIRVVGDNLVAAYLDEHLKPTLDQLRAVVDTGPQRFIVLEDAFHGDDELKTNLAQLTKSKGIELWTA